MPYSNALFLAGLTSLKARSEQLACEFFDLYPATEIVPTSLPTAASTQSLTPRAPKETNIKFSPHFP